MRMYVYMCTCGYLGTKCICVYVYMHYFLNIHIIEYFILSFSYKEYNIQHIYIYHQPEAPVQQD